MAKSLFVAVLVLCSVVLTSCEPVKILDCGSKMSTLEEVDVVPCPNQPCELKKGTTPTVEVRFKPKENITKAVTLIYGIIGGTLIPFPPPESDACKDQEFKCPMMAEQEYKFKSSLPVKQEYPAIELIVQWEMTDQGNNKVYCWQLPVKIVN